MTLNWQAARACKDAHPDLFFGPEHEGVRAREIRQAQAKALCATCPVRAECLEFALERSEVYGIWGGLNGKERRDVIKARKGTNGVSTKPFPHGTEWGARRHREEGTRPCDICRLAYNRRYEIYRDRARRAS
jgi:WhiB family transcriptional regulator, redox-sensing transcriptional regulator